MAKVASEVKAADIRVLFVKPLVYWTRFFIIATAFSRPQIDAIAYESQHLVFLYNITCMLKFDALDQLILIHVTLQVKNKGSC